MQTCGECGDTKITARGLCSKHYTQARRAGNLPVRTTKERFESKITPDGDCLIWQRARNKDGYGLFRGEGRAVLAHRYAWEQANGPIPDGAEIDHRCHNRACVNADHMRLSTRKQNMEHQSGAHKGSKSGVRGVYWQSARQKWAVQVRHNKTSHYAGLFTDMAEAERVAIELRNKLFTHNDADRKAS